jgi:AcrR family transcriptional regulator
MLGTNMNTVHFGVYMTKSATKQMKLRENLIFLAQMQIENDGLKSIRARDLAKQAGCSVGTIYTHFESITNLILAINAKTFAALRQDIEHAIREHTDRPAKTRLIILSRAYLGFAQANLKLWRALFELEMGATDPLPDWYVSAMDQLFTFIEAPVQDLFPDMTPDDHKLMARTLFSAVHGVIWLGLENRISAVPTDQLDRMIAMLLQNIKN